MSILHQGFEAFRKGSFGNAGDNLFVDAKGAIRRITDNDLNGNGLFDIALPNSHGYIERGPTFLFDRNGGTYEKRQLPHDSCWKTKALDMDGDGYVDLVVANGENGVSSQLPSYLYWGGEGGLTGERMEFPTTGAYDVAACDLTGNGLSDLIFTTAWYDHHNPGVPMEQKVFIQTAPRVFEERTADYGLLGVAATSLLCEDLNGDGYPELVVANYRDNFNYDCDSFVYFGSESGFSREPLRLPTHYCMQVLAADLNGDGYPELIFTGGSQLRIFWNRGGRFSPEDVKILETPGMATMFCTGVLPTDVADIDGDGVLELVTGTDHGIEIRKADRLDHVEELVECYAVSGIRAVDISGDGRCDLIASHYTGPKNYDVDSHVFWSGYGKYGLEHATAFETHGPMGCDAADLDGDGEKEIIFCNTMSGPTQWDPEFPVFVYFAAEDGTYPPENRVDYPTNITCHSYIPADVDNDGYVELIVTTVDGLRIFQGTEHGPDPENYYDLHHGVNNVGGILIGDFNRDGYLDLIMSPWVIEGNEASLRNSVYVYYGGPEGYSDRNRTVLPAQLGSGQSITLADINGDGYLDFVFGDYYGDVGVYYGTAQGFDAGSYRKIPLKDKNGALVLGLAAADIDHDGKAELCVTTAGHYTLQRSFLYLLRDGESGYPLEKQVVFETGGTTGFPAFGDLYGTGNLDLILPFYSTSETRELPMRIFRNDGHGNYDWENPQKIDCLASIAALPVDLNQNGYPDLFVCCHRNDLGHTVDSLLIPNSGRGLDLEHAQKLLGYGPHSFNSKNQGNALDRSESEFYTSSAFPVSGPRAISWVGETPHRTSLSFRVRFGATEAALSGAPWSAPITESGAPLSAPAGDGWMQYQVEFKSPALVDSAKLYRVEIQ